MSKFALTLMAAASLLAALPAEARQYGQPQYPTRQGQPSQTQYGAPQYQPQYPTQTQYAQPQYNTQPQYGAQPQYGQQPSGGPLSSIFSCQNPGNRQGTGAVVGALAGGLIGNQVTDKHRGSATVIGALVGAAAGSYIGCQMQTADQQRAQASLQAALEQNRSQVWNNPQTGASGRFDVVETYNYGQQSGSYDPRGFQPVSIETVRYAQGVEIPREYLPSAGQYQANGQVNIRSGPSERAGVVASLRSGEMIDGMVRVSGSPWVLAIRDNTAIGYVSETNLRLVNATPVYAQGGARGGAQQAYDSRRGPPCRTFDQTYTPPGQQPQTQRYNACRNAQGEWSIV